MSATQTLIDTAKNAALVQVKLGLAAQKKVFLATFSSYVAASDVVDLDALCEAAIAAKAKQWFALTDDDARFAQDEYEGSILGIETFFLRFEITGKAKVGALARSFAHQMISGAFAVGGAVLQAGLGIVLPGVGSLIGAGLNVGIQKVVAYFMGD